MMDARRAAMLEAMGVEALVLRARTPVPTNAAAGAGDGAAAPGLGRTATLGARSLCIVCAHGVRRDPGLAHVLAQLTRALGVAAESVDWLEADAHAALPAPPAASAYLVLGATLAPALGAQLSTAQQRAAFIAVAADIATLAGNAANKRTLWQVLRPLARRLATEQAL